MISTMTDGLPTGIDYVKAAAHPAAERPAVRPAIEFNMTHLCPPRGCHVASNLERGLRLLGHRQVRWKRRMTCKTRWTLRFHG
jgi:hypothetical protein